MIWQERTVGFSVICFVVTILHVYRYSFTHTSELSGVDERYPFKPSSVVVKKETVGFLCDMYARDR